MTIRNKYILPCSITEQILQYHSLSVVGLQKNTGKTETLNYILTRLRECSVTLGLTSIGVDGEKKDICFGTEKPEIKLFENDIFCTSEGFFSKKKIEAEILEVSLEQSTFGRFIIARAKRNGTMILSGPPSTGRLKESLNRMRQFGAELCIVDGALSRLSLSSPAVTDAMILTTGAAVANFIPEVVKKTKFVCDLIRLPVYQGVPDLILDSVLNFSFSDYAGLEQAQTVLLNGALTENFLKQLCKKNLKPDFKLIVQDFTKIFLHPMTLNLFYAQGGSLKVLQTPHLIAVTVNPVSPKGFVLNSTVLKEKLFETLQIPVYDVREMG